MTTRLLAGVVAGVIAAMGLGLVVGSAGGTVWAQQPDADAENPDVAVLVDAASGLYELGDYAGATQAFEDVVTLGVKDPVLYYNLGVAYLQTDRPALAVLNFRRALALDGSDKDASANLALARQQLASGDLAGIAPPGTSGLTAFSDAVVGVVPAPALGGAAVVMALIMAVLWLVFRGARRQVTKHTAVYIAAGLALAVGFAVAVVAIDAGRDATDAVLPRAASLYSGPGTGYVDFLTVPAGIEVSVVDERDDWVRLALPTGDYGDGVEGWAKRSSVELVLP